MVKQSFLIRGAAIVLAFSVLFASCSSTTLIQSEPSGAKVYMNEEYKGVTPLTYSDTKIVGSVTTLRLEKEGYETFNTLLSRNERVDVGAIIGGLFVLVPFLWTMQYNPTHTYELKPLQQASLDNKAEQPATLTDSKGNEYVSGVLKN
ncbi:MAG TPA: PEGA domain-containing protein [Bacteroidales bacterium]|nr:PEGA domain-containing protein [Bacteroidales bacterium]